VNARFLFVALLLFAHGAYAAGGRYERTKDGQTRVWNISPKPGEAAAWSGDRDADGYATGYGTIIWYKTDRKTQTGSFLPRATYIPFVRYSGKMVRGKLEGQIETADPADGKTFHAKFADGIKVGRWIAGPSPALEKRRDEPVLRAELVEAPAEGPAPSPVANHPPLQDDSENVREQGVATRPANQSAAAAAVKEKPPDDVDESLRSILSYSSWMRMRSIPGASSQASSTASSPPLGARLTTAEVVELADAEARTQGYDLGEYQRPQARYAAAADTWSVIYDQKSVDGKTEIGKSISVSVEDKTKKVSVPAAR
jgi:hypothetical protein